MTTFDKVCVREEDAIRLIIEFLSRRDLCISQLSLERESGVYNCNFTDDLIFLRQLIIDGQWSDVFQFISPLESLENFSSHQFRFIIYKHKYVELLCIRSEASAPSHTVAEVAVQDIIECLNHLERYCPNRDEYNRLSALLTIPNLTDDEELRNWNPNSWRLKCFHDVLPLVEKFMLQQQQPCPSTDSSKRIAKNDRLMNLIFKGLMYEVCLDAVAHKFNAGVCNDKCIDPDVMNGVESTFNLYSFLQSVPNTLLEAYQADSKRIDEEPMNLDIEKHDKPLLVASWSEMILSTPIKPNVFPHSQVPFSRIKAADLLSKSLSISIMKTADAKDLMTMSVCDIAQFSRSTLAATGFHLSTDEDKENSQSDQNCDTVMTASVDRLFKGPDVFSTSKCLPSDACEIERMPPIKEVATPTTPSTEPDFKELGGHSFDTSPEAMMDSVMNESYIDIWMRSHQQQKKKNKLIHTMSDRKSCLPPSSAKTAAAWRKHLAASSDKSSIMPATMLSASEPASTNGSSSAISSSNNSITTTGEASSDRAALNHLPHNSTRFAGTPLASTPKALGAANSIRRELFDDPSVLWNSPIEKSSSGKPSCYSTVANSALSDVGSNKHGLRSSLSSPTPSHSTSHTSSHHHQPFDLSSNLNSDDVRFVPVAKIEDQQAIRTAEFHPSGRYFAVGSNSKLLRVFQYSSQDTNNNAADSFSDISPPELIYKRPKYHKGSIYCLAWNKIGNLLATGSNDKTIKLIRFNQESRTFQNNEVELPVHDGTVRDLCFMDDLTNGSSLLLSGGAGDCKVNITDCETSTTFLSLSGHSGPVLSLYTWGGAMFVSGSQDRTIRFWDLRSNSCINFVTCPTISRTKPGGAVAAVSVDPSGKLLVSGHEDSTCMLYDIRGGRVIQTFHPHTADIRTIRFSSKAYYLLSGGYDNKIVLTDLQGDLTQPLKSVVVAEHEDKVIQCRWHPTEFVFLSTSADKTTSLWALPD